MWALHPMPPAPGQACVPTTCPLFLSPLLCPTSCIPVPVLATGQGSDLLPGPPDTRPTGGGLSHVPLILGLLGSSLSPPSGTAAGRLARAHPFEARRAGRQQGAVPPKGVSAWAALSSLPDFKGTGLPCPAPEQGKVAGLARHLGLCPPSTPARTPGMAQPDLAWGSL